MSSKIAKMRHSNSLSRDGPEYVYESRIVPYKVKTRYSGPTAGGDITKKLTRNSVSELGKQFLLNSLQDGSVTIMDKYR